MLRHLHKTCGDYVADHRGRNHAAPTPVSAAS
jgi:hypothetical protein